jgi:lipopolysaccharide export system permease protein
MRALYYDISNKQPELLIKQGVFSDGIDDFSIKISRKNDANNMMYDFMIYDHKEKRGNAKVYLS